MSQTPALRLGRILLIAVSGAIFAVIVIVAAYTGLTTSQNVSFFCGPEQPGPSRAQQCASFLVNDAIAAGAVTVALIMLALIRRPISYRRFAHFAWVVVIASAKVFGVLPFFIFILSNIGI